MNFVEHFFMRRFKQCAKSFVMGSLIIFLFALVIRVIASINAYPVAGDAAHFVQHGIALAHGDLRGLSLYWSQGMIGLAALAEFLGLDPRYVLQWVNILSGSIVCVLFYGISCRVLRNRAIALVIALWACVNPKMVQYSVTGYSEMSYMLFLYFALLLFVCGLMDGRRVFFVCTGLALGMGAYFKALDACVVIGALVAYATGWFLYAKKYRSVINIGLMVLMFAGLIFPLCAYTYQRTGSFSPGSKGSNFALGDNWKDSKFVYDVEQKLVSDTSEGAEGMLLFAVHHGKLIGVRWLSHMIEAVRLFNNQLFSDGVRLGSVIFSMTLLLCSVVWWKRKQIVMYGLLFVCLLTVSMICLCFVHDRLLVPVLPIVLLFVGSGVYCVFQDIRCPLWLCRLLGIFVILFFVANARLSAKSFENEFFFWRYQNVEYVGKELRNYADESDIIMCQYPHLAIEFYKTNAMSFVEMPYGEITQVEQYCEKQDVDIVVVSDQFRSHWPIVSLYHEPELAPKNWFLKKKIVIPSRRWDIPDETYLIYSRRSSN